MIVSFVSHLNRDDNVTGNDSFKRTTSKQFQQSIEMNRNFDLAMTRTEKSDEWLEIIALFSRALNEQFESSGLHIEWFLNMNRNRRRNISREHQN